MVTRSLAAHDFWIEPSSFEVKVGDPIRVHLRVGERFVGDAVVRNESRIERFVVAGPGEDRPVIGREGMDPAGLLRLDAPGIWYVGYSSKPSSVQLAPAAFELYLREEGLESIIEQRAARNESGLPGREQFSRSVKSLLRAGPADPRGYDRVLGLPLEFVPAADPLACRDGQLPLLLLFGSHPLPGALVVAYRKDAGTRRESTEAFRGRTDADGRVVLPVGPGQWLVKAVHMRRAAPGSGADWHSVWTALTFEVPITQR
jgi:hypothetical protein